MLAPTTFADTEGGVPVLLTFDAEDDRDALAIKALQLSKPSTFFLTGQFAERHPRLVAELAKTHTIGSHSYSHPHLTQVDSVELRKELLITKMLLQEVTGSAPVWFRAPYLEYDSKVMDLLGELGFRFDSSDQERWTEQTVLLELPISTRDRSDQLASDYDMFVRFQMTDAEARSWLEERYRERASTGRPFVFLMHPRIIAEHKQVLFDFVAFVRGQGGHFLSSDQWMQRVFAPRPRRVGVWVDLSLGEHDPEQLVEDLVGAGITDAFLMARDPEGNDYFQRPGRSRNGQTDVFGSLVGSLRGAGIRVHAWLPVFHNSYMAQLEPRLAMLAENGTPSTNWLSPNHPEVQQVLLDTAAELLKTYDVQGIHLDYLRYPDLSVDFSPFALKGFSEAHGLTEVTPAELQRPRYRDWIDWRETSIVALTERMHELVRTFGSPGSELSAALIADAAVSYRSQEQFGQNYSRLAANLDIVIPMAYFKEERKPPEWISQVLATARYRVGKTRLFTGLAAYQKPGEWTLPIQQFERSIEYARTGSDGVVFYPYLHLFSRKSTGWDMPRGSAGALKPVVAPLPARRSQSSSGAGSSGERDPGSTDETPLEPAPGAVSGSWRTFSIGALFGLLTALVWSAARRRRNIRSTATHRENASRAVRRPIESADWSDLDARLRGPAIGIEDFDAVFDILRSIGSQRIAAFRLARVLDALRHTPLTGAQLLAEISAPGGADPKPLRYIEECVLLDYVRMSGDRYQITPTGLARLEVYEAQGYSSAAVRFIERRLAECLVVGCPGCGDNARGHWFWTDADCPRCGRRFQISNSSRIEVCLPFSDQATAERLAPRDGKVARLHADTDSDAGESLDIGNARTS